MGSYLMRALVLGTLAALAACGSSEPVQNLQMKAETVLPPGQSGFFSNDGQAAGSASGNPADYGAHVDDQRLLYWSFGAKPSALGTRPGTPESPLAGVEIYRDSYGVPIVYAGTAHDLWFGVGYAIAQDRLFLMDAVRRTGAGTLAELTGCDSVPADAQQRALTYSDAEYQQLFDALSPDSKDFVQGYIDGANAWREIAIADPNLLPAEYTLLSTLPAEFTVKDVLAAGVYITRFVAAEGGNEFLNIQMLRQLELEYGSRDEALKAFQDMVWLEDPKALTSVPAAEGVFSNQLEAPGGRDAVFGQMAAWALALPDTVWKGVGTGHAPPVGQCAASSTARAWESMLASAASWAGSAGLPPRVGAPHGRDSLSFERSEARRRIHSKTEGMRRARISGRIRGGKPPTRAIAMLKGLRRAARPLAPAGHSFAFALGRSRTADRGALLISAPQLGYSYPLLLAEYEIHGAGYDARGVSVPILPVVGIGYTADVAWALTTGYSKTIDSFIETICSTAQRSAGTCGANQYFHQGTWQDLACRTETVFYRGSDPNGVPFGPAEFSADYEICRTVHGPLVAREDAAGLARSVQYAMFGRELETIEGVREWNRAHSFGAFVEGVKKVTWNENVTVASRDGDIGFFHPGLFLRRPGNGDMRLPLPGTGAYDFGPPLAFAELPHTVNPTQGFVANWNTKPALGWLDGEGLGSTSRAAGPGQRATSLIDKLAERSTWRFADLRAIDIHAGTTDPRAREYLPVIENFRATAFGQLDAVQKAALERMLAWDRKHYGAGIDPADDATWSDSPGATIFGEYVSALRDELFGSLKDNVIDTGVDADPNTEATEEDLTIFNRIAGVGSHRFDQSVMDNVVIRVLNPASSGLAVRRDYTGGRSRDAVMLAALNTALQRLAGQFNGGNELTAADLEQCRRAHPTSKLCSLTGVIGPGPESTTGCVEMPYQDRGSWVHRVGFEEP